MHFKNVAKLRNLNISKTEEGLSGLYSLAQMKLSVFIKIEGREFMNISC